MPEPPARGVEPEPEPAWRRAWRELCESEAPPSFVFPASLSSFLLSLEARELRQAWQEEPLLYRPPETLRPDGRRAAPASEPPDLEALGMPGEPRRVRVCAVDDAFVAYEGLLFALRGQERVACASRRPVVLRMAAILRPGEIFPGGGPGGLQVDPRCFLLSHVLQGASKEFEGSNFLYDEARVFGNGPFQPPKGGDVAACCVHIDRLCPVIRLCGCNFMHFCAASLPVAVAACRAQLPPGTKFLVYPRPFAREFLELLGVKAGDVVVYDPGCVYHADELFLVEGLNEVADLPAHETVAAVRDSVLAGLPTPQSSDDCPRQTVLIIDRRGARGLANTAEVEETVRSHLPNGFRVSSVCFEVLSLAEQLATLQDCAVLIGTDGAGLTHSLFLPDGATVIDITPTGDEFGPLPSRDGYGYIHHLITARGGVEFRCLAVPEACWGSESVKYRVSCPQLHWLGMHEADVSAFPIEAAVPFTKRDYALQASLLRRPEVLENPPYAYQVRSMKRKYELEALHAVHGPEEIALRLVPEKILRRSWL